ncbi:MAG: RagB/SusD family nutrient uptake outer membrane protein [Chitinophagaceae bacterium]|nr:RagB/SusD family nutrient uptake outer membrane protein [Chitinophagaceae bacterium]
MQSKNKATSCLYILLLSIYSIGDLSCKKLIQIDAPKNAVADKNIFETDATAIAVMNTAYIKMSNNGGLRNGSIASVTLYAALSADELAMYPGVTNQMILGYYKNALNYTNITETPIWDGGYNAIYIANSAIEGLNQSKGLTPNVKTQLLGEAYFIRALNYFYLTNLYGDIPLALSTNYAVNATLSRSPKAQVWEQIVSDLGKAKELLSDKYLGGTLLGSSAERVRPSKWTAIAALARTYLYLKKYAEAATESSALIGNPLFTLEPLNNVFLKTSRECIWSVQPVTNGTISNSEEGRVFILPAEGPTLNGYYYYLDKKFYDLYGDADQRKLNWINSVTVTVNGIPIRYYYPFKYKIGGVDVPATEYSQVFRLAEQYLIRAEAKAKQNDIPGALDDLNAIRNRAGLVDTTITGKPEILDAIMKERRLELFLEYGHRWLDLKRTNRVDDVMTSAAADKGGQWKPFKIWYPLSETELKRSPALKQTEGY